MKQPLNIFVDLDDTLIRTHEELVRLVKVNTGYEFKGKGFITIENTQGHLRPILEEAKFMLTAKPNIDFIYQLQNLKDVYKDKLSIGFCTHRGYHPKAIEYTEKMFRQLEMLFDLSFLEVKSFLCPFKHPNKVKALETNYDNFILIDDNPKFKEEESSTDPRVMIYTKEWNKLTKVPSNLRIHNPLELIDKLHTNPIFKNHLGIN